MLSRQLQPVVERRLAQFPAVALRKIGIEIKFSAAPKPARGFWQSLQDLGERPVTPP